METDYRMVVSRVLFLKQFGFSRLSCEIVEILDDFAFPGWSPTFVFYLYDIGHTVYFRKDYKGNPSKRRVFGYLRMPSACVLLWVSFWVMKSEMLMWTFFCHGCGLVFWEHTAETRAIGPAGESGAAWCRHKVKIAPLPPLSLLPSPPFPSLSLPSPPLPSFLLLSRIPHLYFPSLTIREQPWVLVLPSSLPLCNHGNWLTSFQGFSSFCPPSHHLRAGITKCIGIWCSCGF